MPASPGLSTSVAVGSTGHVADTNTVHTIVNNIYKASIGTTITANATLAQSQSGEVVPVNSGSPVALTVPVLEAGTSIEILRKGTGAVTLVGSGVTLSGPTGAVLTPRVQGSSLTLLWLTTTDVQVSGDLS